MSIYVVLIISLSLSLQITATVHIVLKHLAKDHRGDKGIINLIHSSTLLMLAFLLFNKVTNEQYFVYLVGFLLMSAYSLDNERYLSLAKKISKYLTIAALIAGVRIILFIPYDIWVMMIGERNTQIIWSLAPIGGSISPIGTITLLMALMISAVFYIDMLKFIIPHLKVRTYIKYILNKLENMNMTILRRVLERIFLKLHLKQIFLILIIITAIINLNFAIKLEATMQTYSPEYEYGLVGVYYNWWYNPSHNISIKAGLWANATLTPMEGYYDLTQPYIINDIEEMKNSGIDFAILDYFYGDVYLLDLFNELSSQYNFSYAVCFNLYRLKIDFDSALLMAPIAPDNNSRVLGYYALREDTKDDIINALLNLAPYVGSNNYLKVDEKPIIFIRGALNVLPDWSYDGEIYMALALIDYISKIYNTRDLDDVFEILSFRWNTTVNSITDILLQYPSSYEEFAWPKDNITRDWNIVYRYAWRVFWEEIIERVKNILGDVFIIFDLNIDSLYIFLGAYPPINVDAVIALPSEEALKYGWEFYWSLIKNLHSFNIRISDYSLGLATPSFVYSRKNSSLIKAIETYNETWNDILEILPDIIVIYAWNDYLHGSAIEPTKEFNYVLLELTQYFIGLYKDRLTEKF